MYFPIFDPYDEKYDIFLDEYNKSQEDNCLENNQEDNSCLICWDTNTIENPIRIQKTKNIISYCNCNILVHEDCLHKWIRKTNSCPICREPMNLTIFHSTSTHKYLVMCIFDTCLDYLCWALMINMYLYLLYNCILIYYILLNYKDDKIYTD
jgi:hypothetical protein